ncbi:ubiquitin-like-specific protease ESD4 [Artemisia annua]|uniref:Ubiquitin-like-specific protease ESD4 n=1 Tax=Artemisia annua TaxID=35608 RepID=A0A2U1QP36_ARTAN|nr:ubiquitin-like-specific protease ESD4 [Artemisia annua]
MLTYAFAYADRPWQLSFAFNNGPVVQTKPAVSNFQISSACSLLFLSIGIYHPRYDCGMFMIKYIDFYSRDVGLCFSQDDMPYFRKRTAKEIFRLRAN